MAAKGINGVAVASLGAGALFVYAGVKGYSIPHAVQAIVRGQPPSTGGQANPVTTPGDGTGTTTAAGIPAAGIGSGAAAAAAGGRYSNAQLQSLWIMAGGNPAKAAVAACIADAESSGNTTATSPNPDGGTNAGLWQLDTPGGKGAGYTVQQLFSAITNARVAVSASSNGTDWSAWATHSDCGV
jgi:Lysozyme like domain